MNELGRRARNAMLGLAMGDALGWPAMFHRSRLLPPWTRRLRREMDAASEDSGVLPPPMPFSLNQPAEAFDIGPTDDSEWAAFTAGILLREVAEFRQDAGFEAAVLDAWLGLANSDGTIRGGVSVQAAISNLRKGLRPPRTGKENPHYFDDGAVARAVPVGIFHAGKPGEAATAAGLEASVTHAEDGVWAAQSMAVAISLACDGKDRAAILETSVRVLPEGSLVRRLVDETLAMVDGGGSLFPLLPKLNNKILSREYSYGNAAPETLALTFAIVKAHGGEFERAMALAGSFARSADALPAAVGALAGAMSTDEIAGESWISALTQLKGICIPSLAGANYVALVERLVDRAIRNHDKKA